MTLCINAPAKINPYLWVGPLRDDGFHDIETVFQAISLCDTLTFTTAESFSIRCSDPSLDGNSNLVAKAYRLASEIVDLPFVEIFIEKRIPTQAGLGGGSSDAAAALRVFDSLSHGALTSHLHEIGLACGSDVPFFMGGSTRAAAKGRGEKLEPLPPEERQLVIAKPIEIASGTTEAYRKLDQLQNRPLERPDSMPYNDFERVAPCESLELIDRMKSLGIKECGLCGSGSAVYGFTESAGEIACGLAGEKVSAVDCRTITKFGEIWTR